MKRENGATLYQMSNEAQTRATFSLFKVKHITPDLVFSNENLESGMQYLFTDADKFQAMLNIHHWIAQGISALVSYNPEDGQPEFGLSDEGN
jgi:hypothetical protein